MTQTAFPDPYESGRAAGWKIVDASALTQDLTLEADVVIVGSGAGGGTAAEILAESGWRVVLVEEGPLQTSRDFRMSEGEAYPALYQESAARKTRDKAINILQGRCVGGSTTVNWTSSFRTPPATLAHWAKAHGLKGYGEAELAPWFERMEKRLNISPWPIAPNENNDLLRRGAQALGIPTAMIRRNVRGCWNLGYCGMGCPTNAKQSMLLTTVPAALAAGATLLTRTRAEKLALDRERVTGLECRALDAAGIFTGKARITVRAQHYVLAAGAIGSPALLLRSGAPDPHGLLGRRTFLHPTVVCAALLRDPVEGFSGAPQTVYSDHFLDTLPVDGPIGFKLEAPPIHPVLAAITLPGEGAEHARWMRELPRLHVLIALLRDGFHPGSEGGRVLLRSDGSPVLDYPFTPYLGEGFRRALKVMAEIQFAAGARVVMPMHQDAGVYRNFETAKRMIAKLSPDALRMRVVSAHVMGGCPLGDDPRRSVVNLSGRHHQIENAHVFDGSLFPTSIGANPQLSIYALAARLAEGLVQGARRG